MTYSLILDKSSTLQNASQLDDCNQNDHLLGLLTTPQIHERKNWVDKEVKWFRPLGCRLPMIDLSNPAY